MELQRITQHTKPTERKASWHVIDAEGERLGRLASRVVNLLQGKHKADYSKHQIAGDFVIVVNAGKIGVSGNKRAQKIYYRHTGYIGHLRSRTLDEMLDKFPERVIEQAVKGMLPHNRLGRQMFRRLKVYSGAEHPHEAQVNAGTAAEKAAPAAPATRRRTGSAGRAQAAANEAEASAAEARAAAEEADATEAEAQAANAEAAADEAEEAAEETANEQKENA